MQLLDVSAPEHTVWILDWVYTLYTLGMIQSG